MIILIVTKPYTNTSVTERKKKKKMLTNCGPGRLDY